MNPSIAPSSAEKERKNNDINQSVNQENYERFVKDSLEQIKKNLTVLSHIYNKEKSSIEKFLSGRDLADFKKYQDVFEKSERELLCLQSRLEKEIFQLVFIGKLNKNSIFLACLKVLNFNMNIDKMRNQTT
jgi:hypothetical protein